jgi:hypothetical protein
MIENDISLPDYDPDLHLVFDTEAEAIAEEALISKNMGFKEGNITSRWDIPRLTSDGRWIIGKP